MPDDTGTVADLQTHAGVGALRAHDGDACAPDRDARPPRRLLFVDDEQEILDGLRDALHRYRREWRMRFAHGVEEALAMLAIEPADVVITDIHMPVSDGGGLLAQVQELYPSTIRIVLSGCGDTQVVARAATVAHRILAKPCDPEDLARVVRRSCALQELTEQAELFRAAAAATTLPSRPGLYMAITEAVLDPRTRPEDIAEIIERDTAMTAKLLQLANSAFFGIGRTINRVRDAVVYLGADTIKALTLSAEAFSKLTPTGLDGFSIDAFQNHATLVARIAARIAPEGATHQDAVTAGLLHDIGHLVLIADDSRRWQQRHDEAERLNVPLHQVELEHDGITHATIGAYLLSLWGLPDGVVEAVAGHHDPGSVPAPALDAVAAVHIADALAHECEAQRGDGVTCGLLDLEFVQRLGVASRLREWRVLARAAAEAGSPAA